MSQPMMVMRSNFPPKDRLNLTAAWSAWEIPALQQIQWIKKYFPQDDYSESMIGLILVREKRVIRLQALKKRMTSKQAKAILAPNTDRVYLRH